LPNEHFSTRNQLPSAGTAEQLQTNGIPGNSISNSGAVLAKILGAGTFCTELDDTAGAEHVKDPNAEIDLVHGRTDVEMDSLPPQFRVRRWVKLTTVITRIY
jgi:hypothetical protein